MGLARRCRSSISSPLFLVLLVLMFAAQRIAFADAASNSASKVESNFNFDSVRDCVWETEIGDGFRKHATELAILGGAGPGMRIFGSSQRHNIAVGIAEVGTMLSGPVAKDHFWCGNLELLGELFGGEQFHPRNAYVVGIAPIIRYNFATGTPLVPFVDGGAGASLTDIRHPDLSTDFEFNVQVGVGVHWFFKPKLAATLEGRWLHLSNAGMDIPNNGVNTALVLGGINWFF